MLSLLFLHIHVICFFLYLYPNFEWYLKIFFSPSSHSSVFVSFFHISSPSFSHSGIQIKSSKRFWCTLLFLVSLIFKSFLKAGKKQPLLWLLRIITIVMTVDNNSKLLALFTFLKGWCEYFSPLSYKAFLWGNVLSKI